MIPNGPLQYSKAGDALTKGFEHCYLRAYPDPASPLGKALQHAGLWTHSLEGEPIPDQFHGLSGDPWTVGWGETGPDIGPSTVFTKDEADARLRAREDHIAACVNSMVDVELTQEEFDALCDFAYNAGVGALQHSTLLRDVNARQWAAAADEFLKWVKAGGVVMAGLMRRRQAEAALFKTEAQS